MLYDLPKRPITLVCSLLASCAFALPVGATEIVYDLSGVTQAPLQLRGPASKRDANQGYQWSIDWSGAVLTHNTGKKADTYKDDTISITGVVRACVGAAGADCFGADGFERIPGDKQHIYVGAGDFELDDVIFDLDPKLTNSDEDLYASAGRSGWFGLGSSMETRIGSLNLIDTEGVDKAAQKIKLGLKQNPDLGYAFRLFDNDPNTDGLFQIFTWLTSDSYLFSGKARSETRPGEAVFNGELFACLLGADCSPTPPTEVPEPGTLFLLGAGLVGLKRRAKMNE